MIENVELLFAVLGVFAVFFIVVELVLDIDTFAGKFISDIKNSKSNKIETMDREFDSMANV